MPYLEHRGFGHLLHDDRWTVGYAPAGWTSLNDHLIGSGWHTDQLLAAGLVSTCRRGTTIDRFRDRITFGIRDTDANLVGFTARSSPAADTSVPKYLNTPRTEVYHKGQVLLGLGEGTPQLRDGFNLVLVEGPLDFLAIDRASTDGTTRLAPMALCGTAMTHRHATLLGSLVQGHTIVAFDHDDAGTNAMALAYAALRPHTASLYAARLSAPDPAGTLQNGGPDAVRQSLGNLRPLLNEVIDNRIAGWPNLADNAEAQVACLRSIAHLIGQLPTGDITTQAARLPAILRLDQATITRELADVACSVAGTPMLHSATNQRRAFARR